MDESNRDFITPESIYYARRAFLKKAVALGCVAGSVAITPEIFASLADELGDAPTDYDSITSYNNFYEFSTSKSEVARLARSFSTTPWRVEVGGMCQSPKTYELADLLKRFPIERRIYRLRCVEAWSMIIPWNGFELNKIIDDVKPLNEAKFLLFVSAADKSQMPGVASANLAYPYREGLRLDEAAHRLTILATGLYDKPIPPQNGAPIRLVVPWKYGFKSSKSIVKIEFTDKMPSTTWSEAIPHEYGFYANVNPEVDHPRWTQSSERRIGEFLRRKTLPFNGYAKEVAGLYEGFDLKKNF